MQPQPGIFALGVAEHCYLELDLLAGADPVELVRVLADLSGPETTTGGLSVVVGFRPELWVEVAPEHCPPGSHSFEPVTGAGFTMPATQHDAWFWVGGGTRSAVFDSTLRVIDSLAPVASVADEVNGWIYHHDRDLTGFIDGTENPSMTEAVDVAVVNEGPGRGASIVLVQKWRHDGSFAALSQHDQEMVIGRTKPDSIQLEDAEMPPDSHVSRNVIEVEGQELAIYRRNTAYGGPTDHGTFFVGFCAHQRSLQLMLERMAGVGDGVRDALTRYIHPLTGSYYVVPSLPGLARFQS
jgi:putative iron-dependent peroxidase